MTDQLKNPNKQLMQLPDDYLGYVEIRGRRITNDREYLEAVSEYDDKIFWCPTCMWHHHTIPCPKCKGEKGEENE